VTEVSPRTGNGGHADPARPVDPCALADRAERLAAPPAGHDHAAHGPEDHEHNMHNETPHHP